MPSFYDLNSAISFEDLFLGRLFGVNRRKASVTFDTLGQYIRERLRKHDCISPSTAPKAALIINSNPSMSGWILLEQLLKKRLVKCGAPPDNDLNVTLAMLTLNKGEKLQAFYLRTQKLMNDFELQMADHRHMIPILSIVKRFVTELMRVEEYRVYLVSFQQHILQIQRTHGEYNAQAYLTFGLIDIYELLVDNQAPELSHKQLLPSPNIGNDTTYDNQYHKFVFLIR